MSRHPEVKWAQREDKVFITVQLPDAKNAKVNVDPNSLFTFSATAGPLNHLYELNFELFDKINLEESKINIGLRSIICILEKAEKGWWKKLVRGDGKPPHYIKIDWDRWVDEDDDTGVGPGPGPSDMDFGGMDFSNLNMGGMGEDAMGGFDDSDDEEVSKPETEAEAVKSEEVVKGENLEEKKEAASSP